jgi:predicted nucleic acid-binding protein
MTAVDTNIFAALWEQEESLNLPVRAALLAARRRDSLVISAPVYAELLAFPSRREAFLDTFFRETNVTVDWNLSESIWRLAGRAFQGYVSRRRRNRDAGPRRIMADFLIGAHAQHHGYSLLTFDDRIYRAAFPQLVIVDA